MKWILVSGPPGAGKSTLANVLAHALGIAVLDKDCIDEPFSPDDRGPTYTKDIEPKVLTAIFSLCERNFSNGVSLMVDLPWTHILIASPNWKARVIEIADKFDCDLKVIELCIEEDLLKERLTKRGLPRDKIKLSADGWEKFKASDHIDQTIDLPCLQLDAALELTEKIKRSLEYIKS